MNLVSSFFFRYLMVGLIACSVISNAITGQSQELRADSFTATYRKALESFGGPTIIRYAPRPRSDLSLWTTPESVDDQGIVLDWNEEKITLLRPNSDEPITIVTRGIYQISHTFRFARVNEFQTAYRDQRFQDALSMAPQIIGSKAEGIRLARWEQKLVLAMLIESCKSMDRWEPACTLFVSLAKDSPPDLLAAGIPIPWFDSVAEIRDRDQIRKLASTWLQDQNEMVKLIGASWLLDGELRDEAVAVLKSLSRDSKHPLVSPFATAQLWRTIPPAEFVNRQIKSARALRDSVFFPAQAGLTLLLAERCNRGGDPDLAVQEWVRVVTIHPEQSALANHAKQSALDLLKSTDREDLARLIDELAGKMSK